MKKIKCPSCGKKRVMHAPAIKASQITHAGHLEKICICRSCSLKFPRPQMRKVRTMKSCLNCGEKILGNGNIFCSKKCSGSYIRKPVVKHSALSQRAAYFKKDNCERCGGIERLAVHHINKNKYDNSPDNIMTLCNHCHALWHWEHGKVRNPDLKPRKRDGYYRRYGHEPPVEGISAPGPGS